MTPNDKLCPYCGETIKSIAIKCRHCKSDLMQNIAPSPVAMKNCNSCGENIEINATICPYCDATPYLSKGENDAYSQSHIGTLDYDDKNFERNALIYTGYASAVFNAIYYLLIDKYFSQSLYILALVFNISVSIFCAVMYVKDRKQLTRDERNDIPWCSNLFFILFFAVVAIPLYLAWIAKRTNIKSDAIKAFIGYAIAISIGIFASISVTNKMMVEFGLGTLSSPETINENNLDSAIYGIVGYPSDFIPKIKYCLVSASNRSESCIEHEKKYDRYPFEINVNPGKYFFYMQITQKLGSNRFEKYWYVGNSQLSSDLRRTPKIITLKSNETKNLGDIEFDLPDMYITRGYGE